MKFLLKGFWLIYCIYSYLLFVFFMLLIFPFVVIASFWGKIKGGNMIYRLCRIWADLWFPMIGVRHKAIYHSRPEADKPYIFVANHISYFDIPVIMKCIRKKPVRVLGKSEMKGIPIFGFIYRSAVVMVERSNPAARTRSVRTLMSVLRKGISIFIYPEGTFNETHQPLKQFYDGAFRIAIETQTPIRPILFLDTYDRMNYSGLFTLRPGICRSVYLHEVPVEGLTIRDISDLKTRVYEIMEKALYEYRASWIKAEV